MRKRRDDAEAEREEMDRLKAEESRLREQQQYGDWQKKEEHFHLKQATQRSKVRQKGRMPYIPSLEVAQVGRTVQLSEKDTGAIQHTLTELSRYVPWFKGSPVSPWMVRELESQQR